MLWLVHLKEMKIISGHLFLCAKCPTRFPFHDREHQSQDHAFVSLTHDNSSWRIYCILNTSELTLNWVFISSRGQSILNCKMKPMDFVNTRHESRMSFFFDSRFTRKRGREAWEIYLNVRNVMNTQIWSRVVFILNLPKSHIRSTRISIHFYNTFSSI